MIYVVVCVYIYIYVLPNVAEALAHPRPRGARRHGRRGQLGLAAAECFMLFVIFVIRIIMIIVSIIMFVDDVSCLSCMILVLQHGRRGQLGHAGGRGWTRSVSCLNEQTKRNMSGWPGAVGWQLRVQRYSSNTASFVFYGIACLIRLI